MTAKIMVRHIVESKIVRDHNDRGTDEVAMLNECSMNTQ